MGRRYRLKKNGALLYGNNNNRFNVKGHEIKKCNNRSYLYFIIAV